MTGEERRVLHALQRAAGYGAAGAGQVAREAGMREDRVRPVLLRLIEGGYVVGEGGGPAEETYDLTEQGRSSLTL